MNILVLILKILGGLAPQVMDSIPPPDPERRERRDAMRAKRRWYAARRRLYLAKKRNAPDRRILHFVGALAKWEEALERLGEDIAAEEARFLASLTGGPHVAPH